MDKAGCVRDKIAAYPDNGSLDCYLDGWGEEQGNTPFPAMLHYVQHLFAVQLNSFTTLRVTNRLDFDILQVFIATAGVHQHNTFARVDPARSL